MSPFVTWDEAQERVDGLTDGLRAMLEERGVTLTSSTGLFGTNALFCVRYLDTVHLEFTRSSV